MLAIVAKVLATHAVAMLMLSVALRMPTALVHEVGAHKRVLARALVLVWVAVPLLALGVLLALHPTPRAAALLMVLAICPGVPLVVRKSSRQHGDATVTLLILIATALTALVLVPVWSIVLAHTTALEVHVRIRDVAAVLAPTVLVPFVLGRLVVYIVPRFAAPLALVANVLFAAGLAVVAVIAVTKVGSALRELGVREVLATLFITAGAAGLGWAGARGSRAERTSVAYAAALGNPVLALSVVAHGYSFDAVPWLIGLIVVRAIALLPVNFWIRRTPHGES